MLIILWAGLLATVPLHERSTGPIGEGYDLVFRARLSDELAQGSESIDRSVPRVKAVAAVDARPSPPLTIAQAITAGDAAHVLRGLHLFLRSTRLYERDHPRISQSLNDGYESLRALVGNLNGLDIFVDRKGLIAPKVSAEPLPDTRGELQELAKDLQRAGIHTLSFAQKFHVGELDTLAQLLKLSLLRPEENSIRGAAARWHAQLLAQGVEGIAVNTQTERNIDTVLASLMAALVAYGGNSPRESSDAPIRAPGTEDLLQTLRLLARLTPPLEASRSLSPEEAARAIHRAMEEASRETVRMLLSSVSQHGPREGERPQPYLLRLSELLIFEFLTAEFSSGALAPTAVRSTFNRLADTLVSSGEYQGPHASAHLSSFATEWAAETNREKLVETFWLQLPPREKSTVLRGPDVWCVPVIAMQRMLKQLAEAGADAPRREARNILLNYLRRIEIDDAAARRSVAAGLNELSPIIESLWPNQIPDEISRAAIKTLEKEAIPEIAALLAGLLETLARISINRGDYSSFEGILVGLEQAPSGRGHEHMSALAQRMIAQDRWLLLVDAALANRALDPALPRLLQRDPERLLDRLTLLLTEPHGFELLPAMARLLRVIGEPVLAPLEMRLYEARRQRVSAAIRLLATIDPDRLLRGVARALASWEWNLQDLAVSELARPANAASAQNAAFVFSAVLADANPLVVPMMIDQIGLAQELSSVPQLMEIAAGEHTVLRDQFVRIKAIEALGRLRAIEALDLLRAIVEKRDGLSHAEPSGIRGAAEDALALIEDRPSSPRARAALEATARGSAQYVVPRRYVRVPLESPLRAQIDGAQPGLARVKTISMGGAYLSSPKRMNVGDHMQLEVRSGLSKIQFTAVVRNAGPDGNGVEFVHMKDEDRDKLRKLVHRHLQS